MAWLDTVEADRTLSEGAHRLSRLFAKHFVSRGRYSSITISEGAVEMDASTDTVLATVQELEAKGYLRRLFYGPSFQINVAIMMPPTDKEAA